MKPLALLAVTLCLLIGITTQAQEKYSKVKININADNKKKFGELAGLLQLDHFAFDENGWLDVEIGPNEMNLLRRTGYQYKVVIPDIQDYLRQDLKRYNELRKTGRLSELRMAMDRQGKIIDSMIVTPSAFQIKPTFGGYYSYAEMVTAIDNLVAAYPTLIQKINIGTSGRTTSPQTIWAVKISDAVTTNDATEPDVLYMGLQHAREAIGGSSMIFFMQYLCEQYGADPRIKALVDAREVYIIPCVNPDGWEYNRLNGGAGAMWRKNRRQIGGNIGVDLNRNYSVDWNTCGSVTCGTTGQCGSTSGSSDTYIGTSAFSEPESRAVRDLCYTRNFVAAIDQHAYGPYYSLPYGKTARTLTALEDSFYKYVPALMGQYNGMRAGNSCESVGYEVAGGVKDWWLIGDIGVNNKGKMWGMTGEGAAGGGLSGNNFWAPSTQIEYLCKGMTYQNLQLAYAAGSLVDLQDLDDIDFSATSGSFKFALTRVGLQDNQVTVSMIPLENISSVGAPVTANPMPNYMDNFSGSISYTLPPTFPAGQRIKFAWRIETGGQVFYDTVVKFYNPVIIFSDNAESNDPTNKWTFANGWGYSTDRAYQGTYSIAESPNNLNYTAGASTTTRIATYAGPTINLAGATAAHVSFWVRHRSENFCDLLRLEVSPDGSTWTAVSGTTTVQELPTFDGSAVGGSPALTGIRQIWTKEVYDLQNHLNATNLRLRFRFTSDPSKSGFDFHVDQGFNIDNFKIIKSHTSIITTLPVDFLTFYGKVQPDQTIRLDWDVSKDDDHDFFIVEKTSNGTQFNAIGKVTGIPPYSFIDNNPAEGNNFYRIKQVDKDGEFVYSNTVNVVYKKQSGRIAIYPNPVNDNLHIDLGTGIKSGIVLTITDITGRNILTKKYTNRELSGSLNIDVSSWKPQQYIVKLADESGETLVIQKFLKQ